MQQRCEQIGAWSTATRGGGWVKDDCLCGVQGEKTPFQAERPNLNCRWQAITGECEGIKASFAVN